MVKFYIYGILVFLTSCSLYAQELLLDRSEDKEYLYVSCNINSEKIAIDTLTTIGIFQEYFYTSIDQVIYLGWSSRTLLHKTYYINKYFVKDNSISYSDTKQYVISESKFSNLFKNGVKRKWTESNS